MAVVLTLVLAWPSLIAPWLYPLYHVVLLATRERDDGRRCEERCSKLWQRYRTKLRWRIVPFLNWSSE